MAKKLINGCVSIYWMFEFHFFTLLLVYGLAKKCLIDYIGFCASVQCELFCQFKKNVRCRRRNLRYESIPNDVAFPASRSIAKRKCQIAPTPWSQRVANQDELFLVSAREIL